MKNEDLNKALVKKALGFEAVEQTEEFGIVDGELKLVKRKTATKVYPPDLSALQLLIDKNSASSDNKYANMSLKELEKEKLKLIKLLSKEKK